MISVVIPSYNRADRIKQSAESVLNQTYKDLELIIVDDGSKDNTKEVVKSINDSRVKYIYQENSGACVARNNGIQNAKGEYIAFQDSDDIWHSDKLEIQLKTLSEFDADVCFCQMKRFNYNEGKDVIYPMIDRGNVPYNSLLLESLVSTQTILAKKEVCEKIKFDVQFKARQDWDWVIRAAHEYNFCVESKPLVDVYLQNDSITSQQNVDKIISVLQQIYNKYEYLFKEYPEFQAMLLDKIGYQKTIKTSGFVNEYKIKYKLTGSKGDMIKYLLSKLHMLHYIYNIKKRSL